MGKRGEKWGHKKVGGSLVVRGLPLPAIGLRLCERSCRSDSNTAGHPSDPADGTPKGAIMGWGDTPEGAPITRSWHTADHPRPRQACVFALSNEAQPATVTVTDAGSVCPQVHGSGPCSRPAARARDGSQPTFQHTHPRRSPHLPGLPDSPVPGGCCDGPQ